MKVYYGDAPAKLLNTSAQTIKTKTYDKNKMVSLGFWISKHASFVSR